LKLLKQNILIDFFLVHWIRLEIYAASGLEMEMGMSIPCCTLLLAQFLLFGRRLPHFI